MQRTKTPIENEYASEKAPVLTNFTTSAVYAAIIDYYFQPPTVEPKLLQYGFTKESLPPPFPRLPRSKQSFKFFNIKSSTTYFLPGVPFSV